MTLLKEFDFKSYRELVDIAKNTLQARERSNLESFLEHNLEEPFFSSILDVDISEIDENYKGLSVDQLDRAMEITTSFLDLETIKLKNQGVKKLPILHSSYDYSATKVNLSKEQELALFKITGALLQRLKADIYRHGNPDPEKVANFDYDLYYSLARYSNLLMKSDVKDKKTWMMDKKEQFEGIVKSSSVLKHYKSVLTFDHDGDISIVVQPEITQREEDASEYYDNLIAPSFTLAAQLIQLWTPQDEKVIYDKLKISGEDFSEAITSIEATRKSKSTEKILNDLGEHVMYASNILYKILSGTRVSISNEEREAFKRAGREALKIAISWAHKTRDPRLESLRKEDVDVKENFAEEFKTEYLGLETSELGKDAPGAIFSDLVKSFKPKSYEKLRSLPIITTIPRKYGDFDLETIVKTIGLDPGDVIESADARHYRERPVQGYRQFKSDKEEPVVDAFAEIAESADGVMAMAAATIPGHVDRTIRMPGFSAFDGKGERMHGLGTMYYLLSMSVLCAQISKAIYYMPQGSKDIDIMSYKKMKAPFDILSFRETSGDLKLFHAVPEGHYFLEVPYRGVNLILAQTPTEQHPVGVYVFYLEPPVRPTGRTRFNDFLSNYGFELNTKSRMRRFV